MADQEQLRILREGPLDWNHWREQNQDVVIDLTNTNLSNANLTAANLRACNLTNTDLTNSDLTDTDFTGANLSNANLSNTTLDQADLRYARNYILSDSYTRNARFQALATDPWSLLRRMYTGPAMLWTTLALITAFIPFIAKVLFWSAVNRSQNLDGKPVSCGSTHDCYAVWQMVIGVDKGLFYWAVPVLMILYNLCRGYITYRVTAMRDEEDRSGYSPRWNTEPGTFHAFSPPGTLGKYRIAWSSYEHLYYLHHYFVRWIFWLAFAMFVFNASQWMFETIGIPT